MMNSARASALMFVLMAFAMFAMGCTHAAEPAKSPTGVGGPVSGSPPPPQPTPVATKDSPPPPPAAVAPNKVFVIELDAAGRSVIEGETIEVKFDRMIFLRDSRMAADCSNVTVSNLFMRKMGSICQVGILPLEQGLKPGEQKTALWKVGEETRSFSFKVIPIDDAKKKAESDDDQARLWRSAKGWFQQTILLASL